MSIGAMDLGNYRTAEGRFVLLNDVGHHRDFYYY
jgi:hypothetical protein